MSKWTRAGRTSLDEAKAVVRRAVAGANGPADGPAPRKRDYQRALRVLQDAGVDVQAFAAGVATEADTIVKQMKQST